jgi:hypothetical protein
MLILTAALSSLGCERLVWVKKRRHVGRNSAGSSGILRDELRRRTSAD